MYFRNHLLTGARVCILELGFIDREKEKTYDMGRKAENEVIRANQGS